MSPHTGSILVGAVLILCVIAHAASLGTDLAQGELLQLPHVVGSVRVPTNLGLFRTCTHNPYSNSKLCTTTANYVVCESQRATIQAAQVTSIVGFLGACIGAFVAFFNAKDGYHHFSLTVVLSACVIFNVVAWPLMFSAIFGTHCGSRSWISVGARLGPSAPLLVLVFVVELVLICVCLMMSRADSREAIAEPHHHHEEYHHSPVSASRRHSSMGSTQHGYDTDPHHASTMGSPTYISPGHSASRRSQRESGYPSKSRLGIAE